MGLQDVVFVPKRGAKQSCGRRVVMSYVPCDSPQAPVASVIGFLREERYRHCPAVWQGRNAFLGPRLRRLHGQV